MFVVRKIILDRVVFILIGNVMEVWLMNEMWCFVCNMFFKIILNLNCYLRNKICFVKNEFVFVVVFLEEDKLVRKFFNDEMEILCGYGSVNLGLLKK